MLRYESPAEKKLNKNKVSEFYQLQEMNHHLFLLRSQSIDILCSVQTYNPDSSFTMKNWTLHIIELIFRLHPENPNNPVKTKKQGLKDQWFPLKSASLLGV